MLGLDPGISQTGVLPPGHCRFHASLCPGMATLSREKNDQEKTPARGRGESGRFRGKKGSA
jgi:hypothetical protein